MAKAKVTELGVETPVAAGFRLVYGLAGDSLNWITETIRKRRDISWVHVRHEEVAAFSAGAEAHLIGHLRAEDPANVKPLIERALAYPDMALMDVVVNRHGLSMPPIELSHALGFCLYAIKAVLGSRGDVVIDPARTNLFR